MVHAPCSMCRLPTVYEPQDSKWTEICCIRQIGKYFLCCDVVVCCCLLYFILCVANAPEHRKTFHAPMQQSIEFSSIECWWLHTAHIWLRCSHLRFLSHIISQHVVTLLYVFFECVLRVSCFAERVHGAADSERYSLNGVGKRTLTTSHFVSLIHFSPHFLHNIFVHDDRFIWMPLPYAVHHYNRHSFSSSLFPRASLVLAIALK